MKLAPAAQTQLIRQLRILGFHIVVFVVSVASAAVTAAERSAFWDTFLLHLSYDSLVVVSINRMLSIYHAHFLLYLLQEVESFLSQTTRCICLVLSCIVLYCRICRIGRLYVRFPYGCICCNNFFFDKRETTDTTIWKPGLKVDRVKDVVQDIFPGCISLVSIGYETMTVIRARA